MRFTDRTLPFHAAVLFIGIFLTMIPALQILQSGELVKITEPIQYYFATGVLSAFLDNAPTYLSFLSAALGALTGPELIRQVQHLVEQGAGAAAVAGPDAASIQAALEALRHYHAEMLAARRVDPETVRMAYLLGGAGSSRMLAAISAGAVFFGAATYIGNGPNFMVRSIAEHQKANVPGFLGYLVRFTLPFLLPMLALVWLLFFRAR